jgi:hypothetical protein
VNSKRNADAIETRKLEQTILTFLVQLFYFLRLDVIANLFSTHVRSFIRDHINDGL